MIRCAVFAIVVAGCGGSSSATLPEDPSDPATELPTLDDGGARDEDTSVPRSIDAPSGSRDAAATSAGRDAGAVVVDAPSGSRDAAATSAGRDAGAVVVDAAAVVDAGPCVESVDVPLSPSWAIKARYVLGPNTTQSVPYYCPTPVDGNACRFTLDPSGSKTSVRPPSGACRMPVPARCLVCTGGVTLW